MVANVGRKMSVAVIGSGLGGLAAACVLAARGHRVTVLEKNDWLGGKAAVLRSPADADGRAFRFDMGPTILTVPRVLERIFGEAGRTMSDYLDLRRLDPQWRCFFDDAAGGGVLDLCESVGTMKENIAALLSADPARSGAEAPGGMGARYERFIEYARRLHRISDEYYFWKSIESIRDMIDPSRTFSPAVLGDVLAMRMGSTVASTIRKHVPEPRLAQMLDHFTQYVGSSPYGSPAILCGIASMQVGEGVWYPIGGTRAVPLALERLGRELGVEYRTGASVGGLMTRGRRVVGVIDDQGREERFDAVVSNMDAVRTYRELLGGRTAERFERRRGAGRLEPACSGVVLYLGLKKAYDHLLHHGFVFSRDPEEEFEHIYRRGEPAPDPTCYLAATARTEAPGAVAPPGGEALYVLVHTPYLRPGHDWSKMLPAYREVILGKLETTGRMPDIRERIVFESALTPRGIHDRYRVLDGAIYGLASHGRFLGAFKPGNRRGDLEGLYLAGGAAHPGPGMPMVMMSGWIAADCLDRDAGRA